MSDWKLYDGTDQSIGRLATQIAGWLMGKDLADYAPHKDPGRHVVVINCDALPLSERRGREFKHTHSGYLGNLKSTKKADLPRVKLMVDAVTGMLPKNRLGRTLVGRLHCYADDQHPYNGQINA